MEMKPVHCCLLLVVVCILFLSITLLEGDEKDGNSDCYNYLVTNKDAFDTRCFYYCTDKYKNSDTPIQSGDENKCLDCLSNNISNISFGYIGTDGNIKDSFYNGLIQHCNAKKDDLHNISDLMKDSKDPNIDLSTRRQKYKEADLNVLQLFGTQLQIDSFL